MQSDLILALEANQAAFGFDLGDEATASLADYYELLLEYNPLPHLVGPCSPVEFATRHILESLTMLNYLPQNARFADVGTGGGLPAIPCLIVRDDICGRLIESKEKKVEFLDLALDRLGLKERSETVGKQFNETDPGNAEFISCRALDKFPQRLARLIRWSGNRGLLFFGGEQIGDLLREFSLYPVPVLMPLSERRYLFVCKTERSK